MAGKMKKSSSRRIVELSILFLIGTWLLITALRAGSEMAVPYAYDDLIDTYAEKYDLDKSLVAAVIYQESRFRPQVVSRTGATGLMQIMPDTGKWVAQQLEVPFDPNRLKEPEYNIRMGTYYLSYLMDKYQEDEQLVLAAYNAGPGNVDSWLKNSRYSKSGRLTQIPFRETREYVPNVMKMKGVYRSLYAGKFRQP